LPPKRWVSLSIREEVRKALDEIASEKGFSSINDVVVFLLEKYREYTDISVKHEKLLTDILVKLEKLLTDTSVNTDISVKNTATKTQNKDKEVDKPPSSSNVWCKKKSEIKSIKSYVDALRARDVKLRDWWEEDDQYCFEVE
jgi:hypothetical protein